MAKSRLKAVDPKKTEPNKPKIMVFGKAGVGKTWTSLDFPLCYYIDTEGGASRDHYTDKLAKANGVYFGVEEGSQDFSEVIEQVKALATEKHPYKTLVIDSITKIFNNEIANEAERLGEKDAFGASKKPAVSLTRQLISWIDRLDMNVIIICHEKPLWLKGEQVGVTFDAWEKLEYELDLCLNIVKLGSDRKAFIKKSRLQSFPEASNFLWAYDEFATRYGKEVIEREVKPVILANEEQLKEFYGLIERVKLPEGETDKWLKKAAVETFNDMDAEKIQMLIEHIKTKYLKGE